MLVLRAPISATISSVTYLQLLQNDEIATAVIFCIFDISQLDHELLQILSLMLKHWNFLVYIQW